jgi:hypothetical protein
MQTALRDSKVISREPCPQCRGKGEDNKGDNLALYDDGHAYCYKCGFVKFVNGKEKTVKLTPVKDFEMLGTSGPIKDRNIWRYVRAEQEGCYS